MTQIAERAGVDRAELNLVRGNGLDRSGNLNELAAALALAQAQIKPAAKDHVNPYFKSKYADLASVVNACRDALTANGLAVVQRPIGAGDVVGVTTTLLHSSGQWIEGTISIVLPDPDVQKLGSALTYLRRYSLASMVGVCPDDDDAEAATTPARERRADPKAANDNARRPSSAAPRSSASQWREYDALRESMQITEEVGLTKVGAKLGRKIATIGDLSAGELDEILAAMRAAAGR